MANQPTNQTIVSGQNILVPAPSGGEAITVTSSPSGNLTFEFDITQAEPSRENNDLVLKTPQGEVSITNFFAVGDEKLPTLTLGDGTVVDPTDFFADSGVDMTTAAGPGARATGSGTNYSDAAGELIDGVDRMGSLGTFQWNRETESDVDDFGLPGPSGSFTFSTTSEWNGGFIGGVYEDGHPDQHLGDNTTVVAGKISLDFSTGPGTIVGSIIFSGVPSGTFYIGNPAGSGTIVNPDSFGNYVFSEDQLLSPGIYYLPAENDSDEDISFTITATFIGADGSTITLSQTGTIIIDAVADKPADSSADFAEQGQQGGVEGVITNTTTGPEFTDDGWQKTEQKAEGAETLSVTIPFSATATFYDYKDGSELHYVLVEVPAIPQDTVWTCDRGSTITLWYDGSTGRLVGENLPAGANPANYTHKDFFQIPVANDDILAAGNNGTITIDANLTVSGNTNTIGSDTTISVDVIAKAEEQANKPGDRELTLSNNIAYDETNSVLTLDIINSRLTVNAGWASEGNNDAKHIGGASTEHSSGVLPGKGGATSEAPDGTNLGAPIKISIDGGAGEDEFITQLTFTLGENAGGSLSYNGSGALSSIQNADGSTTYTLTFAGNSTTSIDNLLFVPAQNSVNDADIGIRYTVTVANSTGVKNTYGGTMTVVIDAVADRSEAVASNLTDGGTELVVTDQADHISANKGNTPNTSTGWETDTFHSKHGEVAGEKFTVRVTADFPDNDGSENHYILIQNPGAGWSVVTGDLPAGYTLVSSTYQGKDGNSYFQINVPAGVKGDISEIEIPLQAPAMNTNTNTTSKDISISLKTGTLAEEKAGSEAGQEYDASNNLAENIDGTAIAYTIDVINSTVEVKTGWASEGNNDAQHLTGGANASNLYIAARLGSATQNTNDGRTNAGAPIRMAITGEQGADEYIESVTIKHNGDGIFVYKGVELDPAAGSFTDPALSPATVSYDSGTGKFTITFGDLKPNDLGTDLVYRPDSASDSDTDVTLDYTLTVKNAQGSSSSFEGSATIVIDAVADKPADVDINETVFNSDGVDINSPEAGPTNITAAKPGETVKVTVDNITFKDYADGSEKHYVVVEKTVACEGEDSSNASVGMEIPQTIILKSGAYEQTITVGGTANDECSITLSDNNGVVILKLDGSGKVLESSLTDFPDLSVGTQHPQWNASGSTSWVTQLTGSSEVPGSDVGNAYRIPVLNELLQHGNGSISTAFQITAPEYHVDPSNTTIAGDVTVTLKVGGYAEEMAPQGNHNSNYEYDTNNNYSGTLGVVTFDVGVVTTGNVDGEPSFAVEKIYENATPSAHEGDYTEKLGSITMKGLHIGEMAEVTFTFSTEDAVDLSSVRIGTETDGWRGHNWEVTCDENGEPEVTDNGDGTYSITVTIIGDGENVKLPFHPGNNYNNKDIKVDYDITVTDDASGASKTWSSTNPDADEEIKSSTIIVDAVAQQPVIVDDKIETEYKEGTNSQGEAFTELIPGQVVTVKTTIEFQDYADNSEKHYLYLQWNPKLALLHGDSGCLTYSYTDGAGQSQSGTIPIGSLVWQPTQQIGADGERIVFIKVEVPNGTLQQCGGKLDLSIKYQSAPSIGNGQASIIIRADAYDITEKTVDYQGGEQGIHNDNNIATTEKEITFDFEKAGSVRIEKGAGHLFEGDKPEAHTGDDSRNYGMEIKFDSSSLKTSDLLNEVTFTYEPGRGGLVLVLNGSDPQDAAAWENLLANPDNYIVLEPNTKYEFTDELGNRILEALQNGNRLQFIPNPDFTTAGGTNDIDINIGLSYKVTNELSGDMNSGGGSLHAIVDAVAQQPTFRATIGDEVDNTVTVTIDEISFPDNSDTSEDQYVLIKYIAGAKIILPDGQEFTGTDYFITDNGMYFKIPAAGITAGDEIKIDLTGVYRDDSTLSDNGANIQNAGDIRLEIGVAAVEKVGEGDKGELTYHNNTSIVIGAEKQLDELTHTHDGDKPHLTFTAGYENATKDAHTGDVTTNGDGAINICPLEAAGGLDELTLTYDASQGTIIWNGEPVVPGHTYAGLTVSDNGDGTYTVVISSGGGITIPEHIGFRPGDYSSDNISDIIAGEYDPAKHYNYSDEDVSITWNMKANGNVLNGGTETLVIDAVAQQGSIADAEGVTDHGNYHEALGTTGSGKTEVIIKVPVSFPDNDGSETHYVLVEKQPGIVVTNAVGELEYIEEVAYYKVPVSAADIANGEVEIIIATQEGLGNNLDSNVREGSADGSVIDRITGVNVEKADGSIIYKLNTGTLTVETNNEGNEVVSYNNVAHNTDGSIEFKISPVDTKVNISATNTYEHGDDLSGTPHYSNITVSVTPDENDKVESFVLTYNPSRGELKYADGTDVETDESRGIKVEGGTITFTNPDNDMIALINGGFQFHPGDYSAQDTEIGWTITASDPLSGDRTVNSGSAAIVIDAVAQAPEVGDNTDVVYTRGPEAAQNGETVKVVVEASFEDTSGSETHYAVFEQDREWKCEKATVDYNDGDGPREVPVIVLFDMAGTPYYAVPLDPGKPNAKVEFEIALPATTRDITFDGVKAGAISTESFIQTDGEITTLNNWTESLKEIDISIGVVESRADQVTVEGQGNEDEVIELSFALNNPEGTDYKESITRVIIDPADLKGGTLYVKEHGEWRALTEADLTDEKYSLDAATTYGYKPKEHLSGTVELSYDVQVRDDASYSQETFRDNTAQITVNAVADKPESLTATVTASNGTITIALSASLVDTDGSEKLFFLVEKVDGLVGGYEIFTPDDGKTYYKIPATSATTNAMFTVTPDFDAGSAPAIHAMAQEVSNGHYAITEAAPDVPWDIDNLAYYTVSNAPGSDTIYDYSEADKGVHFTGDSGEQTVQGSEHADTITLGSGTDYLFGSHGNDILKGGNGTDTIDYSKITGAGVIADLAQGVVTFGDPEAGGWKDTINGFEIFKGTAQNDTIMGSSANDTIYGGQGNDTLDGGGGSDVFAWGLDDLGNLNTIFTDEIRGFELGTDILRFEGIFDIETFVRVTDSVLGNDTGQETITYTDISNKSLQVSGSVEEGNLSLTIADNGQTLQTITLTDCELGSYSDADLTDIIEQLIKIDTGGL